MTNSQANLQKVNNMADTFIRNSDGSIDKVVGTNEAQHAEVIEVVKQCQELSISESPIKVQHVGDDGNVISEHNVSLGDSKRQR